MSREFDIPENHVTVAGTEYMLLGSTFAAGGQASLYEAVAQNSDVNRRFLIKRFHDGGDYSEEFESEELSQKVAVNVHQAILAAAFHDKKQRTSVMLKASSDCSTVQDILIAWEDVPPEDPASNCFDMGRFLESIQIVKSLLGALNGIHKHGVLHMDISPSNIMWGKTEAHGTAYLLDFSCCTKIGSIVGERRRTTLSFSAPETQIPGEVLSPAADIYSVGAVFLLLVAGMAAASSKQNEKKWHPRKLPGKGNLNVTAPIGDLEIPDAYKGKLSEIIIKATTSVEKRYQSAPEMLADMVELERIIAGRGMTPETLVRGSAALFRKECDNENGIFHYKLHDDLVTEAVDFDSKTPVDILTQNTILLGAGGAGKTTKVRKLWEQCLSDWKKDRKNNPIPVYVPLNTFDSKKSNWDFFIRDYITTVYFPDLSMDVSQRRADLEGMFRSTGKYVLFLDGINEAVDASMLNAEVATLAAFNNVIVIIPSRNEWGDDKTKKLFSTAELLPLNDDLIINKLHVKELGSPSPRLRETLRRPMFLAMYLKLKITNQEAETPGQILLEHHKYLLDSYKAGHHGEMWELTLCVVLEKILPSFSKIMNKMVFTRQELRSCLRRIIQNLEETDFDVEDAVSFLRKGSETADRSIIDVLIQTGIFRKVDDTILGFAHQNYLEFYQALDVYSQMESYAGEKYLPKALSEGILPDAVMHFLGDILGEHESRAKTDCNGDPSPVEEWLQRHCAGRRGHESQMTVRNLVEVMKWSRERQITANYSNLDLSLANFYDCFLPNSLFVNAVITESTFIRSGHRHQVDEIVFLHSTEQLVTGCRGEKDVCIWDITTGQIVQRITHSSDIMSFDISSDEQLILITGFDNSTVYKLSNGEKARDLETYSFAAPLLPLYRHELVRFCSDNRTFLYPCYINGQEWVMVWDLYTGESKPIIKLSEGYEEIQCCTMSADRKTLYSVSDHGDIAVWCLEHCMCQKHFRLLFKAESIVVTPDETYAILLSDDCAVYGLNLLTGKIDQVCSNIGNDSNGRIQERKLITATNQYVIWAGNRTLGGYAFKEKEHLSFWTPQISAICVDKAGARLFFSDDERRIRIGSIPEKRIISSFEWGKYINWSEPHPIVPHIYDTGIARITRDRHIIQCIQKDNAFAFGNKNCCNYFDANYHICLEANSEGDDHLVLRDLRTSAIIDSIPDDLFCIAYDEKGEEIFATRSAFRWAKYFDTEHKLVVNYWVGLTKIWDLQTHQWTSVGIWSEEVSHILSYCSEDEWDVMRDALIGTSERCFTMGSNVVFGTYDGRIQVWDLAANKITDTAAHSTGIARIYPVPGENYFISEGNDKSRCIWNIQTLERSNCDMHRSLINKDNIIGALTIDEAAACGINLLESAEPKSTDEDLIIHYECTDKIILLACCEKNLSASKRMVSGSGNLVVFYDDPDPPPEAARNSYNSYIRIYDTQTRMRLHNYDLFLSQRSALDDTYIEFTNYAINISLHERTNKLAVAFADGSVLVYDLSQKIPFAYFTWGVIGASDVSHCSFSGVITPKRLAELLTQNGATF